MLVGCLFICPLVAFTQSKKDSTSVQSKTTVTQLKEAVVSGTRFEIPIEKSGKTIYKISAADIEKNAGKSIPDLLNEVPGIQMDGNFGSPGTNLSLFARGGGSKNALILIDGIPINDPSGINASYDLRLLPLSQVASIEVLKGALSSLYGTGASTAVINIKLKEASEQFAGGVAVNYGSFNTLIGNATVQGKSQKFSYFVSGTYEKSDGFSAASDAQANVAFDDDGLEKKNGMVKLGYNFSDSFDIKSIVAYDAFETDYDAGAFTDAENVQTGDMFRVGLIPTYKYDKGTVQLKTLYAVNNREFISSFPVAYKGRNLQVDLNQKHRISNSFTGFWGVNLQNFSYDQRETISFEDTKFTLADPYASLFYENSSGLNIHAGLRFNTHSEYGSKLVYNLNPSYLWNLSDKVYLKLLASVASSYITPSGFQLFSSFGNPELNPEESLNYEFGTSLYVANGLSINLVHFRRDETNAIDFVSEFDADGNFTGGAYQNIEGSRKVNGFETDIEFRLAKSMAIGVHYSFVETDDISTFYRIPKNKVGFKVDYTPFESTTISLKYNHTGMRTIFDFGAGEEVELDSYGLLDLYVQQKFMNDRFTLHAAVNNLTDEDFVAIYGFTTRGRTFNLGLNYAF